MKLRKRSTELREKESGVDGALETMRRVDGRGQEEWKWIGSWSWESGSDCLIWFIF